jgi:hypothetical protein
MAWESIMPAVIQSTFIKCIFGIASSVDTDGDKTANGRSAMPQ